ncbi:MAG TPA: Mu transposase C-terminal domain-containing protein [Mycobacterium sp.]|jgi:putative transposase|nr:Mu transposase C-terminal domain-containing protein [Mycobacterium sp.]
MSKILLPARSPLSASDEDWAEAVRREALIRPLIGSPRLNAQMIEEAAQGLAVSNRRIYSLLRAFRDGPVTASLLRRTSGRKNGSRHLDEAIEEQIEAAIKTVYLTREKPTLRKVLGEVARNCRAAGLNPPSLNALRARVSARTLRERVRAREGAAAAGDRFRQVKIGLRTERPLQIVQIDHTEVDIMLVDDVTRACIGRPWLTLVLDVHTRMVAGLTLSLDPPSAAGTALAVAQAVMPKAEWLMDRAIHLPWIAQGVPDLIHVDNGAEFHSRAFERGCQQHGIRLQYRPPATPRFGGHIERLMGTLMGRIHALPGTTFSDVGDRGDYASEARAVLTFREFESVLALEVLGPYHNEIHTALGRTPAAAWREGTADLELRMPGDADALFLDFLPFEERAVRRDGIRLFNVLYQDGALAHLVASGGGRLRVKYDPRDLSAVFVELPAGDHVRVPYADISRPAVTLWEHRLARKRLREEGRRSVDEYAIFAAIEEQRRILAEAYDRSKSARRAVVRAALAADQIVGERAKTPRSAGDSGEDPDAKVPMPEEGATSGVEFW